MLNIQEEIKILLLRRGTSMKKLVDASKGSNRDIPSESTLSTLFKNNRVRFQTVQDLLDMMGYELRLCEKDK